MPTAYRSSHDPAHEEIDMLSNSISHLGNRRQFLSTLGRAGAIASVAGATLVAPKVTRKLLHSEDADSDPRTVQIHTAPRGRDFPEDARDIDGRLIHLRPTDTAALVMLFLEPSCSRCHDILRDTLTAARAHLTQARIAVSGVHGDQNTDAICADMTRGISNVAYLPSDGLAALLGVMVAPWAGLVNRSGHLVNCMMLSTGTHIIALAASPEAAPGTYVSLPFAEVTSHRHQFYQDPGVMRM
jgi:hypothetical protein